MDREKPYFLKNWLFKLKFYVPRVIIDLNRESLKMVDWKEREHEDVDTQEMNDPNFLEALRACGLLKFILTPGMRA